MNQGPKFVGLIRLVSLINRHCVYPCYMFCFWAPRRWADARVTRQHIFRPQNFNFFIFQFFQKISSRGQSAIYPLPKNLTCCRPGPTASEEIASEAHDLLPLDKPIPGPSGLDNACIVISAPLRCFSVYLGLWGYSTSHPRFELM